MLSEALARAARERSEQERESTPPVSGESSFPRVVTGPSDLQTGAPMKADIHPKYRLVVFADQSAGTSFLTRSTIATNDTIEWSDGNTYPLAKVEISSASHPFFTGTMKIVDTAGRVERFERRYGRRKGRE